MVIYALSFLPIIVVEVTGAVVLSHVVLRRQGATWLWPPRSQHISEAANHRSHLSNELLNG